MANTLLQTAFLRPKMKSKTVKDLYFTGQLTVPGPGVPPALISGKIVADFLNKTFMQVVVHSEDSRGSADHGWLQAKHSFSFAGWSNPERVQFGALRVLNDDIIQGGMGFGTHPHDNMEIITIPLKGDLEHKDSMGNTAVIKEGGKYK